MYFTEFSEQHSARISRITCFTSKKEEEVAIRKSTVGAGDTVAMGAMGVAGETGTTNTGHMTVKMPMKAMKKAVVPIDQGENQQNPREIPNPAKEMAANR